VNIGLDARKLGDGGIGTYIRNLVAALRRLPGERRFVAFVDPRDSGVLDTTGESSGCPPLRPLAEVVVRAAKYSILEHFVVARAARRAAVDLFHAPHYTLPLGWTGPAVVTIHDLTHVRLGNYFPAGAAAYARIVAGAAARRARLVIAVSEHAKSDVVRMLGIPAPRVRVVPNGVSPHFRGRSSADVARFARERSLPTDYLLYVGARKRHKNLQLLLRALALMKPESRPPLVLSGSPWRPTEPLARLAQQLGLATLVHFAGPSLDDRELSCLYSGAALYVHPSLAEGFGLPPLEAMACGVPVLASSSGSLPEVLGDAATLLDPTDLGVWAEEISALLTDQARRAPMIRRGIERARGFTWERTATLTLEVYEQALAGT